ncbi:SRPBCC family protein [Streptomyces sp. SID10815]|uniref:SRPBCC family protein n=1 Tax=Streptomyces sp. SID10815 TaxID=2706027 RepID=UPI0013C5632B|nr:SRPBCC family protein [Streptomyces sp. SID10815]NEA45942.1 polyketide cyclase [Streptomyces sp. SID10815]
MDPSHYRFRSRWPLSAPPAAVYDALERVEDYPRWWRQVRAVRRTGADTAALRVRAVLPYDLCFTVRETRRDPAAGVLEAALAGDLDGWSRWTLTPHGAGTLVHYDQVVDVTAPLLRRLAVPGRPVFRLNHRLMMRSGRRGLAARLRTV